MIRIFFGLSLPPVLRARLSGLCSGLPGARWVQEENFHITLRFIGKVNEGLCRDISEDFSGLKAPPFSLTLRGLDIFGSKRFPRMLWVGVEKSEPLMALQEKIETDLVRLGVEPEMRKFHPHVSLARFRGKAPRLGPYLAGNALFEGGEFPVDHFTLFSSVLTRHGAHYREEARYPLLA